MKKLLSLLSVLTIAGTSIPTVIANSPYQKQEHIKLNRTKRRVHPSRLDIQYDWSSTWNKMIATFSPIVFNDIRRYHECSNNYEEFEALFKVGMFSGIWKDNRVTDSYINNLAKCVWNNWEQIKQTFVDGERNCSIIMDSWASNGQFIGVRKVC